MLQGLPQVYVQVLDFPGANLWVWIGDEEGSSSNLSLALNYSKSTDSKSGQKAGVATPILNAISNDESVVKSKMLSQKLSNMMRGRPVLLSYNLPDLGPAEDLLNLPDFEIQLFKLLKSHVVNE